MCRIKLFFALFFFSAASPLYSEVLVERYGTVIQDDGLNLVHHFAKLSSFQLLVVPQSSTHSVTILRPIMDVGLAPANEEWLKTVRSDASKDLPFVYNIFSQQEKSRGRSAFSSERMAGIIIEDQTLPVERLFYFRFFDSMTNETLLFAGIYDGRPHLGLTTTGILPVVSKNPALNSVIKDDSIEVRRLAMKSDDPRVSFRDFIQVLSIHLVEHYSGMTEVYGHSDRIGARLFRRQVKLRMVAGEGTLLPDTLPKGEILVSGNVAHWRDQLLDSILQSKCVALFTQ